MKKTRKQTALAKCVLATIMAMGMMGYTTVWAEDTVTPSPIDKSVSKDAAGQIYDASHNYYQGYFWTDLGHAQVQIGSGEKIELFTPFIYHTNTSVWDSTSNSYNPVHEGDNSEMKCKESMSRITVGEFDRIIKSLYTNDITMAKTIYGEGDQAGLKDKVIKEVKATPGQGATVNTYKLVRENGTDVAVGIVDTDTKVVDNKLTFANGTLTSEITDNTGGTFASSVNGIASQEWVTNQLNGIGGTDTVTTAESGHAIITVVDANEALPTDNKHHVIGINEDALRGFIQDAAAAQDTNTTNTSMEGNLDEYGKLTVRVNDSDSKSVEASIEGVASRSWVTNQLENVADTNTITTVAVNTNILTIEDKGVDGNHAYELGINSEQLGDFVKQYDTNTITTVGADENGYVTVTEAPDPNQSGNHAYTVSFNEQKLIQTIEDQDRYVNGGSIGEDGSITLNVHNGRDVTLEGQMKDARLTDIERDKEAGTATLVVKDRYNPEEVNRLTIDDIASKEQNDRDHAEFREHFNELDYRVDNLGSRVDKVGAGAAALAALHPMDFDPDDKLTFAAGYGNYKGRNAAAVGAFYRPDEKVMLSVGGTFGNGENMVNAGISFSLDRTARVSNSRTAMAKEIVDLRANVANLTALVGQLTAGMGGTIEMDRMKLFPDVPENHWAYEYIGRLAAAGIVEGYPDGMFNGNRMMSRYEFAAMLYRALEKGVKLDHKLVREFEPEMGRIHVARISGADGDRGKIERVRVYGGDNRDHYGSKLN
ncbi:YadA-like family protein [uncultured Phascolarctobacterium sp.]|uniref:YadA-like family protein n=1 Tax=uncultured Phascolarctobacterium sp. TaxID=512296 RepID=UPI002603BF66|nr:YadA-like family protein [uncultured Phascolarctobacterium sp.]